jgi:hypothetical protein
MNNQDSPLRAALNAVSIESKKDSEHIKLITSNRDKIDVRDLARASAIFLKVLDELNRARTKHPEWPDSAIVRMSFVSEELGEAVKAVNEWVFDAQPFSEVEKELVHTISTAFRFLMEADRFK